MAARPTALAESLSVMQLGDATRPIDVSDASVVDQPVTGFPTSLPPLRFAQNLGSLKPTVETLGVALPADSASVGEPTADGGPAPHASSLRRGAVALPRHGRDVAVALRTGRSLLRAILGPARAYARPKRRAARRSERAAWPYRPSRLPVGATAVVDVDIDDAALLSRRTCPASASKSVPPPRNHPPRTLQLPPPDAERGRFPGGERSVGYRPSDRTSSGT